MDAPQHVLVGYDGSSHSELAFHRAFALTEHAAYALIHVVVVVEDLNEGLVRLPNGQRMNRWSALESLRLILDGLAQGNRLRSKGARVVVHLRSGPTAQTLVDFAYRYLVDQIVVGSQGLSSQSRTQIGSVAREILARTDIPVRLESPMASAPPSARPNAMRFAYVFGGRHMSEAYFKGRRPRASA